MTAAKTFGSVHLDVGDEIERPMLVRYGDDAVLTAVGDGERIGIRVASDAVQLWISGTPAEIIGFAERLIDLADNGVCPAGGAHTWAELEGWDHRSGIGCDECGAEPRRAS